MIHFVLALIQATTLAQDATPLSQCAHVQPVVQKMIDDASARLELARQDNSAAALRLAIDDFDTTLRNLRAQLIPCANATAIDPHAGHAVPSVQPVAPTAPAADPHAGHSTPTPAKPAVVPELTGPAPATTKPAVRPKPPAADPHAGHDVAPSKPAPTTKKPAAPPKTPPSDPHAGHTPAAPPATPAADARPATQATDLVCGLKVDSATAPSARHEGQTYYFCSEQHQQLFQKNPTKYLPKK